MILYHITWCSYAAAPYLTNTLCVACYTCSFSIVPWTLFWPWILWCTQFGSSPFDSCILCGKLHLLFFYCTMNSFFTVNSMRNTLWLCPLWCTHYMWPALLAFFVLYHGLFSDLELFSDREPSDAYTLAPPHVMHTLHVGSSARSFSNELWTLFWPLTLWPMHSACSF